MEQTTTQRVAEQIRAILGRRQLSRSWLARELGMPVTTMNRRLRGDQAFTVDELTAVAKALQLPVTSLFPADELSPAAVGAA